VQPRIFIVQLAKFHKQSATVFITDPGAGVVDGKPQRHPVGTIGEGGNTGYPYELWIYNGSGKPILTRDRVMDPEIGMRYLFIDREGYGRYTLESSSSVGVK